MPKYIPARALLRLPQPTVTIVLVEHLGDIVACEPILRYAKEKYPTHQIAWLTKEKYFEALAGHPVLDYLASAESLSEATDLAERIRVTQPVINLHFTGRICTETGQIVHNGNDERITSENYYHWGSLLEAFSLAARVPALNIAPEFHFVPNLEVSSLPKNYVVFHCLSNEVERDWERGQWRKLLYFFFSRNIPVVELGHVACLASNNPLYHDMTHIHSIQTIAKVISTADFFVGVDSSFAHIANALRVNGLTIMGKYRAFTHHVPYTGMYSDGHIVRSLTAEAKDVSYQDVVEEYLSLSGCAQSF